MTDPRDAWKDVGSKVESLGLKLKLHLEQEHDGSVAERAEGDTQNAFEEMSSKVADAFEAFGNAAKDDAIQSDVRDVATLIKDALVETFRAAGAEVGDLFEQVGDYAEDAADKLSEAVGRGDGGDGAEPDPVEIERVDAAEEE